MPAVEQTLSERFDFRIDPSKKRIIEKAAAAKGLTLTDFAILTLYKEAQEVLKSEHVLVLSDRDRDSFLKALDAPPAANERAIAAAKRYKTARQKGELK
ncbi:MAG TPA: DUF1778 domain-containing protein [Tepidisphaeraceae bacterium]|nr:DUF1778 domain-containing protein [Tepidisphaeraceae bacterium]